MILKRAGRTGWYQETTLTISQLNLNSVNCLACVKAPTVTRSALNMLFIGELTELLIRENWL